MDKLSQQRRSENMRQIRSKDTTPELALRQLVHGMGYRFRLHRTDLPGTPDLVLPRLHKVIFVHGCFWHQHNGCRLARLPKNRLDYWLPKFERNRRRDSRVLDLLSNLGWEALVVWECQTNNTLALAALIEEMLGSRVISGGTSAQSCSVAV